MIDSRAGAVARLLPGVALLRGYERRWLRPDVLAGVTVAAYLVPQVMAYAEVAGLAPIAGLWAVLGSLGVYVLFGSSRQLSVGPESTTALLTATAVAPLAAGDPRRYATLAATLALLVGGVCVLARLVRLGFLAELLSRPVLVGYLTGVAVVMMLGQLGRVSGVAVSGETPGAQLASLLGALDTVRWPTVALSAVVLTLLVLGSRRYPRLPVPLIVVLAAAVAVSVLHLARHGVAVVGAVPGGLPLPALPHPGRADLRALALPAVGIAVVAYTDNVLTARAFAARRGYRIDPNAELLAVGAANLAVGTVHGFPVSSSGSRTAIGDSLGGRTQVATLVTLAAVVLTLLAGSRLLAGFPTPALGALVIWAAAKLIDVAEFRRLARFRRSEALLAAGTTLAVLTVDILAGVLVAVALSVLDLLRRVARPHDGILGYVPGVAGMHDVDDYPVTRQIPGLVVYRYDSPLFFANAEDFRRRALAAVDAAPQPVAELLLNAEAIVQVDLTALDVLDQLRTELARRGVVLAMARVKHELAQDLARSGVLERIGPDRVFPTLPTAVSAYARDYTQRHGRRPAGVPPDGPAPG